MSNDDVGLRLAIYEFLVKRNKVIENMKRLMFYQIAMINYLYVKAAICAFFAIAGITAAIY